MVYRNYSPSKMPEDNPLIHSSLLEIWNGFSLLNSTIR